MHMLNTSTDWSFLLIAFSTGFSSFFSHDFSLSNNHNMLTRKFLLQFPNNFGLDFLPTANLVCWDHQNQSVSSANIDFLDSDQMKLHKLFFSGGIGVVLDVKDGLSDAGLDVGSPLVVFLLEFVGDRKYHVSKGICKFDLRL